MQVLSASFQTDRHPTPALHQRRHCGRVHGEEEEAGGAGEDGAPRRRQAPLYQQGRQRRHREEARIAFSLRQQRHIEFA